MNTIIDFFKKLFGIHKKDKKPEVAMPKVELMVDKPEAKITKSPEITTWSDLDTPKQEIKFVSPGVFAKEIDSDYKAVEKPKTTKAPAKKAVTKKQTNKKKK